MHNINHAGHFTFYFEHLKEKLGKIAIGSYEESCKTPKHEASNNAVSMLTLHPLLLLLVQITTFCSKTTITCIDTNLQIVTICSTTTIDAQFPS